MAVEDKYVDSNVEAGKLTAAAFAAGNEVVACVAIASIAAADSDGSVYRLFKGLSPDLIPVSITITNDAITAGTDYDLGFYETKRDGIGGAVVDKDNLMDGTSMASARAEGAGASGLTAVTLANAQKRLYELAGHTISTKKAEYDIALTANTVGSAAGSIVVKAIFVK